MPPFNYTGHLHFHKLFMLGLRGGEAVTIELQSTAINPCGQELPVQLAELNGTSFCDSLDLVWPQPMCLKLPWELDEFTVIEEHQVSGLESLILNVSVMPSFFSGLLHSLMESSDEPFFF